jgi:ectoine hydroxylase-related dioxygenase (phytanoyl-CoA dioxygenase family)
MNVISTPNPPASTVTGRPTITLTPEQIRSFHEEGFLSLPAISPPEEVAQLRLVFDRLVKEKAGFKEGAQYDLVGKSGETGPPKLTQIISPINYAPELRDTIFRANALSIAKQLLGEAAGAAFEHAIIKPAQLGAATPWHQDEAHRFDPNFDYNQISIWMPLQEATLENGCMQYIPGSNKGEILRHVSPGNDPTVHALETDPSTFDASKAVPCPLAPGGCTIHSGRTLHYAGPNTTGMTRRAYILAFEIPPKPRETPRTFPWNDEKQTDDQARKKAWRKRGGVLVEAARKLRNGFFSDPKRLAFEVRRAARALFK